eukprot:1897317-Pyramimonas_sp.AAC.1
MDLAAGRSDEGRARRWAERSAEFARRALVAPRRSQRRAARPRREAKQSVSQEKARLGRAAPQVRPRG